MTASVSYKAFPPFNIYRQTIWVPRHRQDVSVPQQQSHVVRVIYFVAVRRRDPKCKLAPEHWADREASKLPKQTSQLNSEASDYVQVNPPNTLSCLFSKTCLSPCQLRTGLLLSLVPLILSVTYNCLLQKPRFAELPLNPLFLSQFAVCTSLSL